MSAQILWATVGGLLFGVFTRSFVDMSWPFAAFLCLLGVVFSAFAYFDTARRGVLIALATACVACSAGILRMDAAKLVGNSELSAQLGKVVTIEGVVVDEPDVRESNVRLHAEVKNSGVLIVAPLHTDVKYGDSIRAKGKLGLPESFDTGLGRQFNYPMYLAKDGILYTLSFAELECIAPCQDVILTWGNFLKVAAIWVKQKYLEGLHAALPEPESGLAGGITVGDKRSVGKEFIDMFITVGLVHIIVLSGYNITVVMNLLGRFLSRAGRIVQLIVSIFIVVFIVLIAGASANAVRAGAMAILPLYARISGRLYIALRALGAVAFVMVLWNPYILAFDPGFELSVLATLGLILFSPIFASWLAWIPEKFALREIVASTLGTQLMVLPLILYQNGLLSIVALPANLLTLIVVPWAMGLSVVAAVGGIVFGPFGTLVAFPAYVLLAYIIKITKLLAALPLAAVTIPAFSAWWMVFAYVVLFGGYMYIQKAKRPELVRPSGG